MRTLTSGPSDPLANTTKLSEFIDADEDVVLFFWADWSDPSKRLKAVLETIEKSEAAVSEMSFGSVNLDDVGGAASPYGVTSIPLIVMLRDGKEIRRMAGFAPAHAVLRFLTAP